MTDEFKNESSTDFEEEIEVNEELTEEKPSSKKTPKVDEAEFLTETPARRRAEARENEAKAKRGRNVIAIVVIAVVIVLAAIISIVALTSDNNGDFYDSSAQSGQAPYKTEEEKNAALNEKVEAGMLNISIASVIDFKDGTSEGTAYIENVPANIYAMKVTIALDSNGDVVYESGGMKPDTHIDKIKLNQDLDPGTYPATATFTAYDTETLQEVGQAAAKIKLVIEE